MIVMPQGLRARFFGKDIRISNNAMRRVNLALFGLYALQGLSILVISRPHAAPLQATFLTNDTLRSQLEHQRVGSVALHVLASIPALKMLVLALFILALFHLMQATVARGKFEASLRNGVNPLRWAVLAAALWLVTAYCGLMAGLSDISVWLLTAGTLLAMAFLAVGHERRTSTNKRHIAEVPNYGWLAVLCAYLPVGVLLLGVGFTNVFGDGRVLPYGFYTMMAVLTVLMATFLVNRLLISRRYAGWRNAAYGELWYSLLAFVTVTAVCWLGLYAALGATIR